jgi:glycosyltransferase involved in cell wall biosynthesis
MIFDVMDDLASFLGADPALPDLHVQALSRADVVFTGGRSLQANVRVHRPDAMCCPSGVELEHYSRAADLRDRSSRRPVAGYVGVVDERIDLQLLRDLARLLPDWDIDVVGPVAKIDPRDLPIEPNVTYVGAKPYHQLPEVMAGFDVALMPFALNAATRSISPTKTLEYLAANLPVVSTRVPDVVSEFSTVVDLENDAAGFADACRRLLDGSSIERRRHTEALLRWNQWDTIAARMSDRITEFDAMDDAQEAL